MPPKRRRKVIGGRRIGGIKKASSKKKEEEEEDGSSSNNNTNDNNSDEDGSESNDDDGSEEDGSGSNDNESEEDASGEDVSGEEGSDEGEEDGSGSESNSDDGSGSTASYITTSTNKSGSPNSKNDDAKKKESKTDEKKPKKQSKRQLKQESKNKQHLSKRRVKRERHNDKDVHSILQKTTVGKYVYKLPMTEKQEALVEQTYADYLDSDVLGYRAKRDAEEEQKRLLEEKRREQREKLIRMLTGPRRYIKNSYAEFQEWWRLYRKGKRKVTKKRLNRFIRYAALNDATNLRKYVKSGIPITYKDDDGWNAMHHGAFEGFRNIVRECIKFGIEIDAVEGKFGRTAFWMSCARSDNFSANMLIDNEADVDHVDPKTGMTPIMLCAAANNLNMVERLIDEGAFLTKQDKGGFTALHHAAYEAHVSMVYLLLDNDHERGGARDMKDRSGNLPVDWSLRQRLKEDCKNDKEFLARRIKCCKLLQWGIHDNEYMSDDEYMYW